MHEAKMYGGRSSSNLDISANFLWNRSCDSSLESGRNVVFFKNYFRGGGGKGENSKISPIHAPYPQSFCMAFFELVGFFFLVGGLRHALRYRSGHDIISIFQKNLNEKLRFFHRFIISFFQVN